MTWLLGGATATGLLGVVALAIFIARMAQSGRSDLHLLLQASKDLASCRRDNDAYQRSIQDLEHALSAKTDELSRERRAFAAAQNALAQARKRMADHGDAAGVVADLNDAFDRLSQLSGMSSEATDDSDSGHA